MDPVLAGRSLEGRETRLPMSESFDLSRMCTRGRRCTASAVDRAGQHGTGGVPRFLARACCGAARRDSRARSGRNDDHAQRILETGAGARPCASAGDPDPSHVGGYTDHGIRFHLRYDTSRDYASLKERTSPGVTRSRPAWSTTSHATTRSRGSEEGSGGSSTTISTRSRTSLPQPRTRASSTPRPAWLRRPERPVQPSEPVLAQPDARPDAAAHHARAPRDLLMA